VWPRAEALKALAPVLPEGLLPEGLAAARAIGDEWARAEALKALAPRLATVHLRALYDLWEQTLPVLAARTRRDLLMDLCALLPVLTRLGGPEGVAATFRAIQQVGQWWP
jgi:hypothetical protein